MLFMTMPSGPISPARRFLNAFRAAMGISDQLNTFSDDPDGFIDAIASEPDALAAALADDHRVAPSGPAHVSQSAFASAACDVDGRLVLSDRAFTSWLEGNAEARAGLGRFSADKPSITFLVKDKSKYVAVAAAPLATARNWPLAPEVRACLEAGQAEIAVLARLEHAHNKDSETTFDRAFALTALEARACAALVKAGNTRAAARLAGITYETARTVLKEAMHKVGVASQPALVSLVMRLNSGELSAPHTGDVIGEVFGLTPRQTRVALAVADGHTRAQVAAVTALSSNVVKYELASVYDKLGVDSLAGLSRAMGEIQALSSLAEACSVELMATNGQHEPLRLLARVGRGGRIAFSDYGPIGGRPTLFIHTPTTGRQLPSAHVSALQALGIRPISFDRPGIGLTDPVEGALLHETARDMVDILDALKIERASVVARGGATILARFAAHYPERLDRGVALNPEPRPAEDTIFSSLHGQTKKLFFERPAMIAPLARHLSQRASSGAIAALVRKTLADSAADLATLSDPTFMADYVRSTQRSAVQGGAGFIAIWRTEPFEPDVVLSNGAHMTILAGAQDPLSRLQDGLTRWKATWPGCAVQVVPDTGRLLQFQRPDLIARAVGIVRE
jgi:pimeloyl-ACP methyl ester carboxylesterase/DNA-binding CsgD family transcriptional regulator